MRPSYDSGGDSESAAAPAGAGGVDGVLTPDEPRGLLCACLRADVEDSPLLVFLPASREDVRERLLRPRGGSAAVRACA
jgi:hypothetical protein